MTENVELAPMDAHNETLLARAHPADWKNPTPEGRYNMVVIGAGTAGLVTAAATVSLGGKAAIIERRFMGGDCLNYGCVPSKAIIRCARAAHTARTAGRLGVSAEDVSVDFAAVMERMRKLRAQISEHDSAERFKGLGVDVYLGEAEFTGPDTVNVGDAELTFARACIAAGSHPSVPSVEGLEDAGYLTNETIFSLTELPPRMVVIGGGPIGCEMGQTFARLGSNVTILNRSGQLLKKEDADVAQIIQNQFQNEGIEVVFSANTTRVETAREAKKVYYTAKGEENYVEADAILVATGRKPNVEGLGLEKAGVEYDRKRGVIVDDRLRTSNKRIYAAGDICMKYKFTHAADAAARIVIRNALFWGRGKLSALTVPWCTYTEPEVAHTGMYAHEAREAGIDIDTYDRPLSEVDRAVLDGQDNGLVRIHVKKGTDRILGATIVAAHAGQMISEITLAIEAGVGLGAISNTIHPYPTQAEAIRQLGDEYNRTRLTPLTKKLFKKILSWRR